MKTAHSSTSNSNSKRGGALDDSILGSTLVLGMLAVFVLFLGLWFIPRFFPNNSLCKRGLECALLFPEKNAPFRAHINIRRPQICGDLATMGQKEEFCYPRTETFVTDEFGFRNLEFLKIESSKYVVLGDSFGFGQGLDQHDIPSQTLARTFGRTVYNGAGRLDFETLDALSERAGPGKTFIFLDLDRSERKPEELEPDETAEWRKNFKSFRNTLKVYNPLKIMTSRLDHETWGAFLLNRENHAAVLQTLTDNRNFLFLPSSWGRDGEFPGDWLQNRFAYFSKLQAFFKKRDQKIYVVLVPEKSTAYARKLPSDNESQERLRAHGLEAFAQTLNREGIPAHSLAALFQDQVTAPEERSQPLYYPDDTHWAPRGVRVMAETLKADSRLFQK